MDELGMQMVLIAQLAGKEISNIQESSEKDDFDTKADGSPVTLADLAAHNLIMASLTKICPEIPVVSEEGRRGDPLKNRFCFVVGPLDGTKEFIRGNGMYTVNIAFMERKENLRWRPVFGVVHAPKFGITWSGGDNVDPIRQDSRGIERISVSASEDVPIILGSVSHASSKDRTFAEAIGEHRFEGVGSSMKICRVAEGTADIAPRFGPTSCWDTAAAHAVLNAAGGNLMGPHGAEIDYDLIENILNPWYFATSNGRWVDLWIEHQ